ncbi:histidine triad nucleotide-binding protein 3-like protein [Sarcoptes scabiei]|uniref:Adenosine 5'-monophosphoramidase HINT3 n=1 Tax=Sarcoptes scabiei TaxID=52283 RepID=A0A131ZTE4_SARSC|nr:histidine triad nucleotide-binding protein 3-like protein [Sarcoptes scabiei]
MCIFCSHERLSILNQNDNLILIEDIKPAAENHFLVIPKKHYPNVKYLSRNDLPLEIDFHSKSNYNYYSTEISIFSLGFHWAPFNSIEHLHLHVIYPFREMSLLRRWIFRPNSYWFAEIDAAVQHLENKH